MAYPVLLRDTEFRESAPVAFWDEYRVKTEASDTARSLGNPAFHNTREHLYEGRAYTGYDCLKEGSTVSGTFFIE